MVSLAGTPLFRRLALATGFVDEPAARKHHSVAVPYLGGAAIIVGAAVGMLFTPQVALRIAVVIFGACVMGAVGVLDDRKGLEARSRFMAQIGAATAALAAGIRINATAVPAVDIVLTLVWIVGITNALNLLDNMDGLAGGTAVVTSAGIFALASLGGQEVIATLAAALCGACLGFLVYNVRPASIFMGDAGSLFIGFLLSIGALELDPALLPPISFAVPVILLALPVLDTTTVVLARTRRGRSVTQGGRDHLSHRLVARGLSPGIAVAVLVGTQAICGAVAVVFGRGVIGSEQAALIAGVPLALLALVTARVHVYDEPVIGFPRRLWAVGLVGLGAVVTLGIPAAITLTMARNGLEDSAEAANLGLSKSQQGDQDAAAVLFDRAARGFEREQHRLDGRLVSLGLAVPGLASNVRAARALTEVGSDLAHAGNRVAAAAGSARLRVTDGQVPLAEIERVTPDLDEAQRVLSGALRRVRVVRGSYLVPPIRSAVDELSERLEAAARDADQAVRAARVVPTMLGEHAARRYLLVVQNSADLRATGGAIDNWGELVAENGRVRLERFGPISELSKGVSSDAPPDFTAGYKGSEMDVDWRDVNTSPDFPSVARAVRELYLKSQGRDVDGVMAIDSRGLAALSQLAGPGSEPPINPQDVDFLGEAANAIWQTLVTADLPGPSAVAKVLGPATRGGHLLFYPFRADEAATMKFLGATGNARPVRGDSLGLVTQNAAGNRVDHHLKRSLQIDLNLDPAPAAGKEGPHFAEVQTRLRIKLRNDAPSTSRSGVAIDPNSLELAPGESRSFVSIYTPLGIDAMTVGGSSIDVESAKELGRSVYSGSMSVPSLGVGTLEVQLSGAVRLGQGGWYVLDIDHQATVIPDEVTARISVPSGWRIAETRGLTTDGPRSASTRVTLKSDADLWVRVERTGLLGLWDRLRGGR